MYNYSIIVPHKNCPALLNRLLDSIPKRDDIQIVVVDDNSDDGKKPIVNRMNVEVILLDAAQSKGAGRARNIGLEKSKGNWLLFADADDYFSDNLTALLDKYKDDVTTDIVYLSAEKFDEKNIFGELNEKKAIQSYLNGEDYADMLLRYNMWTPWSRMVRRSVVVENKIKFDEIPACNDKMFGLKSSQYSKKIEVFPETIYYYYRPSFNSQTDNKRNRYMFDDMMDLRGRTIILYQEVGYKFVPSMAEIAMSKQYAKDMSKSILLIKYLSFLKQYKISLFKDLVRFLFKK